MITIAPGVLDGPVQPCGTAHPPDEHCPYCDFAPILARWTDFCALLDTVQRVAARATWQEQQYRPTTDWSGQPLSGIPRIAAALAACHAVLEEERDAAADVILAGVLDDFLLDTALIPIQADLWPDG